MPSKMAHFYTLKELDALKSILSPKEYEYLKRRIMFYNPMRV